LTFALKVFKHGAARIWSPVGVKRVVKVTSHPAAATHDGKHTLDGLPVELNTT